VYGDTSVLHSVRAHAIGEYVPIDGAIKGCPLGQRDLHETVTALLLGKQPDCLQYCVCVECKLAGKYLCDGCL